MASSRRTYDTDSITLRTVFAKNIDNTNIAAQRTLTADGAGGCYWAIPSTLGILPSFNQIITSAGTYTADLSYNRFRLTAQQGIGMTNGPPGLNQTNLFAKCFTNVDISGGNNIYAFSNNTLHPSLTLASQGGIQIHSDPGTNTIFINGPFSPYTVSTGIYGFNQLKVTPASNIISSDIPLWEGDYITAESPSTLLSFAGYNDIQLSTNVTGNGVFFTISTFTSAGYLDISANAYSAASNVSTLSTAVLQNFYTLSGQINARATIIQVNNQSNTLTQNMYSTTIGLGTLGYISSGSGGSLPPATTHGDYLFYTGANWVTGSTIVCIGQGAGSITQGANSVAVGTLAAYDNQGPNAVAIGNEAGFSNQKPNAISIGNGAGYTNQESNAVAIGFNSGSLMQGRYAIAIGHESGSGTQQDYAVAVGTNAGSVMQQSYAVAIGDSAGTASQGQGAVAIGASAGTNHQSANAVAIGANAGLIYQSTNAIAIGTAAGFSNQGEYAIAIGYEAGYSNQHPSSIIINATANPLDATNSGLFIAPLNNDNTIEGNVLRYNTATKEIVYSQSLVNFVSSIPFVNVNELNTEAIVDESNNGSMSFTTYEFSLSSFSQYIGNNTRVLIEQKPSIVFSGISSMNGQYGAQCKTQQIQLYVNDFPAGILSESAVNPLLPYSINENQSNMYSPSLLLPVNASNVIPNITSTFYTNVTIPDGYFFDSNNGYFNMLGFQQSTVGVFYPTNSLFLHIYNS